MSKIKIKQITGHYRVSDIVIQADRSTAAVIRWEKDKLIPKAKRDSRGWRIYTEKQVNKIVELVKETNYFLK